MDQIIALPLTSKPRTERSSSRDVASDSDQTGFEQALDSAQSTTNLPKTTTVQLSNKTDSSLVELMNDAVEPDNSGANILTIIPSPMIVVQTEQVPQLNGNVSVASDADDPATHMVSDTQSSPMPQTVPQDTEVPTSTVSVAAAVIAKSQAPAVAPEPILTASAKPATPIAAEPIAKPAVNIGKGTTTSIVASDEPKSSSFVKNDTTIKAPSQPEPVSDTSAVSGKPVSAKSTDAATLQTDAAQILSTFVATSTPKSAAPTTEKSQTKESGDQSAQPTQQATLATTAPVSEPSRSGDRPNNQEQQSRRDQPHNASAAINADAQQVQARSITEPQSGDFSTQLLAAPPQRETPISAPGTSAPLLTQQAANIPVPPEALGVAIAKKAMEGNNRFEIRLDPLELGRLDITLDIDSTGKTHAHIRAERPEALELLQRDAKGLEQSLRQAGLQFDQSNLTFSLGDRNRQEANANTGNGRRTKFQAVLPVDDINTATIRGAQTARDGLDLRV